MRGRCLARRSRDHTLVGLQGAMAELLVNGMIERFSISAVAVARLPKAARRAVRWSELRSESYLSRLWNE